MSLYPLFLKLAGRAVLVVGGGPVALGKVRALLEAGAVITLVSPQVEAELEALEKKGNISITRRSFEQSDVEGSWLVVAAATPAVNRSVAAAAESARLFVNAVDDPSAATAYGGGVATARRRHRRDLDRRRGARARRPPARGARRDPARRSRGLDGGGGAPADRVARRVAMDERRPLLLQAARAHLATPGRRSPAVNDRP